MELIFQLAVILLATKLAGDISVRLGQPSVLGKLLVGILLGPSLLGLIERTDMIDHLSQIGVILLMFLAGLETDMEQFKKTGKASAYVGVAGIAVPFGLGYVSGVLTGMPSLQAVFLGLLLSATSVSISVQALKEMGKLQTREGATILGAAVIDDILVIVALAFVMSLAGSDVHLGWIIVKKLVFFIVAIGVAWKGVPWMMRAFARLKISQPVVTAALILCFAYACFAEYTGVAAIIGAYIAGLAISQTDYKHEVVEKTETIGYSLFVPVFFVSVGISAEFSGVMDNIGWIVALSVVAIASKLIGASFGAKLAGFGWGSSLGIGAAMVSRGEVALIIASMGREAGLIDADMFAGLVVVVLVTTLVTPPLMKLFFSRKNQPKSEQLQA
ncbi:cation:proton antiporter [Paenibacillus hodogayensis]